MGEDQLDSVSIDSANESQINPKEAVSCPESLHSDQLTIEQITQCIAGSLSRLLPTKGFDSLQTRQS